MTEATVILPYLAVSVGALFILRLVWRILVSPHRPFIVCFLDTLFDIPAMLKIGPWAKFPNISNIMAAAKAKTGLSDYASPKVEGKASFIERTMVTEKVGLKKSGAYYSPFGQLLIMESIVDRHEHKLKLVDYLKRHPKIDEITVKPPVFVIGFPRTGTTFLHEMLGLHESVRMHYTWEQMTMVPNTDDESLEALEIDRKQRYKMNKIKFDILFKFIVSQKIQSIHRIQYDEPEECTIPCGIELPWQLAEIPFMVFAAEELFPLGAGNAYAFYKRCLKLLQWQSKDRRHKDFTWMLKCPFHLPYLEELFTEFPSATVIWTHRTPEECIASCCSLYETIMEAFTEEFSIDRKLIGQAVLNYSKLALNKAIETLEKMKDKVKVVHIRYADTVKDPKSLCKEALEKAGIPFTTQYESNLDNYLQKNQTEREKLKQSKKSSKLHEYKLEDYGLNSTLIRDEFKDYISKFNLEEKKTK